MNPEDIAHLRELLRSSMRAALATASQFDSEGRIALAAKYGGRAGGLEHAIALLDLVEATATGNQLAALNDALTTATP